MRSQTGNPRDGRVISFVARGVSRVLSTFKRYQTLLLMPVCKQASASGKVNYKIKAYVYGKDVLDFA